MRVCLEEMELGRMAGDRLAADAGDHVEPLKDKVRVEVRVRVEVKRKVAIRGKDNGKEKAPNAVRVDFQDCTGNLKEGVKKICQDLTERARKVQGR